MSLDRRDAPSRRIDVQLAALVEGIVNRDVVEAGVGSSIDRFR
jgi:hypothetical protein